MCAVLRARRRGAVIVLTAFMLVVLLGMVAFSVDVGHIVAAKSELQTVADAAALAGAAQLLESSQLTLGGSQSEARAAARAEAQQFGRSNSAGGVDIQLDGNDGNSPDGSIVFGAIDDPDDQSSQLDTSAAFANAVRVTARRSADENGALRLFFGPVLGRDSTEISVTATAAFDTHIKGFQITGRNPEVTTSKLLPIALDIQDWYEVVAKAGQDEWQVDPDTEQASPGSDGVHEVVLYSDSKHTTANHGTVNIGASNNSTDDIRRQILYGVNQSDFEHMGGSFELPDGGTRVVSGDPGLSAGFKDALEAIRGQPRVIPLFSSASGNGANAEYTICGFAGVTIVEVVLTGGNKRVVIQPAMVIDSTVIPGSSSSSAFSSFVYGPVSLCR